MWDWWILEIREESRFDLVVTCDAIEDTLESRIINGCNGIDYCFIASSCFISNQVFTMAGGHDSWLFH